VQIAVITTPYSSEPLLGQIHKFVGFYIIQVVYTNICCNM